MRKRIGVISVTVALLIGTFITTSTANNEKELEKAIQFREKVGFTTDPQKVKEIARNSNNESKIIFGVELTDEELAELNFRSEISNDTKGIKDAANRSEIDGYAGLYIDQKTGTVHVGLVGDNLSTQEKVKELYPYKDRIQFFRTTHTLEQLLAKQAVLDQENDQLQAQGIPLQSWGVSIKENRLEVQLNRNATPTQIQILKNLVEEDYMKIIFTDVMW